MSTSYPQAESEVTERRRWMSVLANALPDELESAYAALGSRPSVTVVRSPETGMVMVRGRISGTGAAFNLGEMTVTRCVVRLNSGGIPGFAYVAGRNVRHAELAAFFDALFQSSADPQHIRLVDALDHARRTRRAARAAAVSGTKVEFFTMDRE